jgi:hypothetical protein
LGVSDGRNYIFREAIFFKNPEKNIPGNESYLTVSDVDQ